MSRYSFLSLSARVDTYNKCKPWHNEGRGSAEPPEADWDRLDILNWLTPTDYFSEQNNFIHCQQAGTGQWLLDSKQHEYWLLDAGQILFSTGLPGAGKTILTSEVIDDLGKRFQTGSSVGVVYIYCNFGQQDPQTLNYIVSSLLKHLA